MRALAAALLLAAAARADDRPELTDTNSAGGTVVATKGGAAAPSAKGGGVIVGANGERLEIVPPARPQESAVAKAAERAVAAGESAELPTLDDPRAPLAERRRRALWMLAATVALALGLLKWAGKWRSR